MSLGIKSQCAACGNLRTVPNSSLGKKFRCKACNEVVVVEEVAAVEGKLSFADGGDLDLSMLRSSGTALGYGPMVTCEECDEPFGKNSEECPSCEAPNPHYEEKMASRGTSSGRRSRGTSSGRRSGISFFEKYRQLIMIGTKLLAFIVSGVVVILLIAKATVGTASVTGREQLQWYARTTAKWIELEKAGKARKVEALWRDQRWMPLEQVLTLDWAALPDWFGALKNEKTNGLAEDILKKWRYASGVPYPEDLQAGIKDSHERVQYWSILIVAKLENQKDKDAMVRDLERFRDGNNEILAEAAKETLEEISN